MLFMEISKCRKIVEFPKISIKVKNFTRPTSRLKDIIQSRSLPTPTRSKLPTSLEPNFLTEIYRNIQAFVFHVLREYISWASRNGEVQMFFLTPTRIMFAGKFVR